jgi:N6-adenosine-specific RNA methylase IME4
MLLDCRDETGLVVPHPFSNIRTIHGAPALDLLGGPLNRYDVIYADPPWSFENYSEKGEDRNAKAWYDCMDIDQIKALPVENLASDNCMLAMWATFPLLPEAIDVLRAWGFEYVTVGFVWIKLNKSVGVRRIIDLLSDVFMSTGYWTRSNAEIVIFAKRGSPQRNSRSIRQVVHAPRGKHSEKPLIFRKHLEDLIVAERRIELFCRHDANERWDAWGNQVGAHDAGIIEKRRPEEAPLPLLDLAA